MDRVPVQEEKEVDDHQQLRHKTRTLTNKRNQSIFNQSWEVVDRSGVKGVIFLFHGLGEHSARYEYVALFFNKNGFDFHAIDHQGHGHSDGDRAVVWDWNHTFDDCDQFIETVLTEYKYPDQLDKFIFGHSMGGLIAMSYAYERIFSKSSSTHWTGVIISSPAYRVAVNPAVRFIAKVASTVSPHMGSVKLDVNNLSRDPEIVKRYVTDPLVYHGGIPLVTAVNIVEKGLQMQSIAHQIKYPFYIFHGTLDKLTDPEGSKDLFRNSGTNPEDKAIQMYEGYYHETMNEPEKDQVLGNVLKWVNSRMDMKITDGTTSLV